MDIMDELMHLNINKFAKLARFAIIKQDHDVKVLQLYIKDCCTKNATSAICALQNEGFGRARMVRDDLDADFIDSDAQCPSVARNAQRHVHVIVVNGANDRANDIIETAVMNIACRESVVPGRAKIVGNHVDGIEIVNVAHWVKLQTTLNSFPARSPLESSRLDA